MRNINEWDIRYEPEARGFTINAPILTSNTQLLRELGATNRRGSGKKWFLPEIKYQELAKLRLEGNMVGAYEQFAQLLMHGLNLEHQPLYKGRSNNKQLRDFQVTGVSAMVGQSLLLGDDMGLGKSFQTATAYRDLKDQGVVDGLLLLVPNEDVGDQWERLFLEEFDAKSHRIKGRKDANFLFGGVTIVTYSKVWRGGYIEHFFNQLRKYKMALAADEAHNLAGHTSKQFEGVRELASMALRVWCLTGTEVANKPDTYWCMYCLVTGSRVDRLDFCNYFCEFFEETQQRMQVWNHKRLKGLGILRRIFALRRLKEDVARELPPREIRWSYVAMPQEIRQLHKDLERSYPIKLKGVEDDLTFTNNYIPLLRCCSHPGLVNPDMWDVETGKLERLVELIREAGNQKVLVWSNWPATIDWLHAKLAKLLPHKTLESVHGKVTKEKRKEIISNHRKGKVDILIANPGVWKEGVELTAASVMVYWDYHPSRVRWNQTLDRIYRIGQKLPVTVIKLAYPDSMDTKTIAWIEEKEELAKKITGR